VEVRALSQRCPRCDGEHELLEHAAVTAQGARLRELRLRCRQCHSRRSLFFQIEETLLH
jgi:transposase-like protein